jgi:hypothetical protein
MLQRSCFQETIDKTVVINIKFTTTGIAQNKLISKRNLNDTIII